MSSSTPAAFPRNMLSPLVVAWHARARLVHRLPPRCRGACDVVLTNGVVDVARTLLRAFGIPLKPDMLVASLGAAAPQRLCYFRMVGKIRGRPPTSGACRFARRAASCRPCSSIITQGACDVARLGSEPDMNYCACFAMLEKHQYACSDGCKARLMPDEFEAT